jgi:hypothetical protein
LAGKSPAEAVTNFIDPLRRALTCVTQAVLTVGGGYYPSEKPHGATVNDGLPVPLKGEGGLSLIAMLQYRVVEATGERGPWKVSTVAYNYEFVRQSEDGEERILAYHWHPDGGSSVKGPHLHVLDPAGPLRKAHLPTGRVALEEVLRVAISELGVKWLRSDWRRVLNKSQKAFEDWRTWP